MGREEGWLKLLPLAWQGTETIAVSLMYTLPFKAGNVLVTVTLKSHVPSCKRKAKQAFAVAGRCGYFSQLHRHLPWPFSVSFSPDRLESKFGICIHVHGPSACSFGLLLSLHSGHNV